MDLRHLRYFQAVAEELSFSRAAERLHVAQPALSRAVQDLEAELGAELLERNRRQVRLTAAGRMLLRDSGLLFERLAETVQRVARTASGAEGELRLGYVGPPTQPFLGPVLAEYRRQYPRVALHLEERTPERVWEMVARRRLSAAITRPVERGDSPNLRTLLLREERLIAVFPPDHPLAGRKSIQWSDLAPEPLVVLSRREGVGLHDAVIAGCHAAGFMPRFAYTPSLIGTVLTYVEAGAGVGVMTEGILTGATPKLRSVLLKPIATVPLVLVWNEEEDTPPVARFRELLIEWQQRGRLWQEKA